MWDVTEASDITGGSLPISTHTSRVGCDAENISKKEDMEFLLTHPVWDVTAVTIQYSYLAKISTHTSRVGCDAENISKKEDMEFLLTHPVWDVTHTKKTFI